MPISRVNEREYELNSKAENDVSPCHTQRIGQGRSYLNRRRVFEMGAALTVNELLTRRRTAFSAPSILTAEGQRPQAHWGVMTSEIKSGTAVVWSRSDRPSEMIVKWSLDPDFNVSQTLPAVPALPETDFTGRVLLTQLPSGRRIFYIVYFESLLHTGVRSLPLFGEFSTPPQSKLAPVRIAWSGDSFGQGYGINPQIGGVQLYNRMREAAPDLFIHCGDRIYADQPLKSMKGGGKGRRWFNLTTPEVMKVAQNLDDFRGYYRYGLLDEPTRRFAQVTSQLFLWDDHEVKNDWWPGRILKDRRYQERSCDVLADRSRQAFFDYSPLPHTWMKHKRIYRSVSYGPNIDLFALDGRSSRGSNDREAHALTQYQRNAQYLGPQQLRWLKNSLLRSHARWKVIACPQPIGIIIGSQRTDYDGFASPSREPRGRELELVELLSFIKREQIHNVVWIAADVHYAASHYFHPSRASFQDFNPFWEFIAGPINAATLRPHRIDQTFGAERVFLSVPERRSGGGRSPLDGEQYFGMIDVLSGGDALKVSICDLNGACLYSERLDAKD